MENRYVRTVDGVEIEMTESEITQRQADEANSEHNPSPSKLREKAYGIEQIIVWSGENITVDKAVFLFSSYFAEGNYDQYMALNTLIVDAKRDIRLKYPDIPTL